MNKSLKQILIGATVVAFTACGGGGGGGTHAGAGTGTTGGTITGGGTTTGGGTDAGETTNESSMSECGRTFNITSHLVKETNFKIGSKNVVEYVTTFEYDSSNRLKVTKIFSGATNVLAVEILHEYASNGYLKLIKLTSYNLNTADENDISSETTTEYMYKDDKLEYAETKNSKDVVISKRDVLAYEGKCIPSQIKHTTYYDMNGSIANTYNYQRFFSGDDENYVNKIENNKNQVFTATYYKQISDDPYAYIAAGTQKRRLESWFENYKLINKLTSKDGDVESTTWIEHNITYDAQKLPISILEKRTIVTEKTEKIKERYSTYELYSTYEYAEI